MDPKTFWLTLHVFGAIIGAGGAFVSDAMFFSSIKDEKLTRTELRFLKLGGGMVWIGLAALAATGVMLVLLDPQRYLSSPKFLAKATIVGVIALNGVVFHAKHFPLLFRHAGVHLPSSDEFIANRPFILASGAISMVSWTSTVILGMLRSLPYTYGELMLLYLCIVTAAMLGAYLLRNVLLPHHPHDPLHWFERLFRR